MAGRATPSTHILNQGSPFGRMATESFNARMRDEFLNRRTVWQYVRFSTEQINFPNILEMKFEQEKLKPSKEGALNLPLRFSTTLLAATALAVVSSSRRSAPTTFAFGQAEAPPQPSTRSQMLISPAACPAPHPLWPAAAARKADVVLLYRTQAGCPVSQILSASNSLGMICRFPWLAESSTSNSDRCKWPHARAYQCLKAVCFSRVNPRLSR